MPRLAPRSLASQGLPPGGGSLTARRPSSPPMFLGARPGTIPGPATRPTGHAPSFLGQAPGVRAAATRRPTGVGVAGVHPGPPAVAAPRHAAVPRAGGGHR
jgi:hypothetical protein